MQNSNNNNFIQSGVALLFLLLLLPCANVEAQTVLSAQYNFPTQRGSRVIVRESNGGVPVISYRSTTGAVGSASFLYGDPSTASVKSFAIVDTVSYVNAVTSYFVNDMRVVGDMCYFCGMRIRDHFEGSLAVTDSVGVLGRFRLPPSGFAQTVKYDLKLIDETKSLDRMAAFEDSPDTVLAMIGIVDNPASESCLTVARVNSAGQWDYYVEYTDNSVVEEVFTDIAVDPKNVTIASYHKNAEGMDHFNLRISDNTSVQNDTYSYFDILNQYTPILMAIPNSCYSLARPGFAAVRLCAQPNESIVYAAFACYANSMMRAYPTGMCEIETVSKILLSAQIVQKPYITPHTLVDVAYLDASMAFGRPATVALLHQTDGLYKSVVEYPFADISNYGPTPTALVQQKGTELLSSVCAHDIDDVRFGGVLDFTSKKLTYLQELLPTIMTASMCMIHTEVNIMKSNDSQAPVTYDSPLLPRTVSMQKIDWGHKTAVPDGVSAENPCFY